MTPQNAFRYETVIGATGKVEVAVPLPAGTLVEVLVVAPLSDDGSDLVSAATSSLAFWDNPLDDEDWNDAKTR